MTSPSEWRESADAFENTQETSLLDEVVTVENSAIHTVVDKNMVSREKLQSGLDDLADAPPEYSELLGVDMRILLTPALQYLLDHAKDADKLFALIAHTCLTMEEDHVSIAVRGNEVIFKNDAGGVVTTKHLEGPFDIDFDMHFSNYIMDYMPPDAAEE